MGISLYIMCRSEKPLTRNQISAWTVEVAVLGPKPQIIPPVGDPEGDDPDWEYLEITYRKKKRPIQIHRVTTAANVRERVGEILETMEHEDVVSDYPDIVARLKETRQYFWIELGFNVSEHGWELIDITQSFIAQELDGIVVSDEGIFNAGLEPIIRYEGSEE